MKKSLIILFFLFTTPILIAQDLTFEETVKYVKEKIEEGEFRLQEKVGDNRYMQYRIEITEIAKNGDILLQCKNGYEGKFNIFKLAAFRNGIYTTNGYVVFLKSEGEAYARLVGNNEYDAERLYKAFQHLRTVCTKESDPFGN